MPSLSAWSLHCAAKNIKELASAGALRWRLAALPEDLCLWLLEVGQRQARPRTLLEWLAYLLLLQPCARGLADHARAPPPCAVRHRAGQADAARARVL